MSNLQNIITGLQHIGIPTADVKNTVQFYEQLGFSCYWRSDPKSGMDVAFLKLGSCVIEVYHSESPELRNGAIDHIALNVTDIESIFADIKARGLQMLDSEINSLPFFEKGVRFFTILGPNAEKIEFNQII
jgi:4-hydroxyphenylpyruvate dioxygenase-like putative hemolysin